MHPHRYRLVFLVAVLLPLVSYTPAFAQSFAELSGRLKPGDTVYVTQANGQAIGKFIDVMPTSLALSVNGKRQDFNVTAVSRLERERSAKKKGALLGLLAGVGVAPGVA